eukprot:XP_011681927.1 PREDICTED: fibropellin-3-like [Strongylocentrotus purpuratus]
MTEANPCNSNPCQNGGTCLNAITSFVCQCAVSWQGRICTYPRSIPITVNPQSPTTLLVNYIQPTGTYTSYDVTLLDIVGQPVQSGTIGPNQVQPDGTYRYIFNGVQPNTNYQVVVTGQTPEGPLDLGRTNTQTPNVCDISPCLNGGSCLNNPNLASGYVCSCVPGYTGQNCQTDTNECISGPCGNGGTCQQPFINMFRCACTPQFTGLTCQIPGNVVVRTGTVTPSSATIIFNAVPGENVQQYSLEVNDQQGNPVQNVPVNPNQATNGQFNIPVNNLQPGTGYIVFVQGAIGGQTFQLGSTTVNTPSQCDLFTNICQNGGTCAPSTQQPGFRCLCRSGFTGDFCETQTPSCSPSPCQNGGTCIVGSVTVTCNCVPGYAGALCQTNINECQSFPCRNGGNCVDRVNSYICNCPSGFTGIGCDTKCGRIGMGS